MVGLNYPPPLHAAVRGPGLDAYGAQCGLLFMLCTPQTAPNG